MKAEHWGVIFGLVALIVSVCTFVFQLSPLLIVQGLSVSEGEHRIYLDIKNIGGTGAYGFEGCYAVTSHVEPSDAETSEEKLLAFGRLNIKDEGFYPSQGSDYLDVVTSKVDLKESINDQKNFVYLSIVIDYRKWPVIGLPSMFSKNRVLSFLREKLFYFVNRRYQGVFYYNRTRGLWVRHSKNHLPQFSQFVFSSLKQGIAPDFSQFWQSERKSGDTILN
ncbi:MAG: hypothetical protein A3G33_05115 [Omnitrophica bacterium RIFCSPLOWO2_12_FULL_44_17]|uniref:Uncharacterized protein n=1 Tax=Candidatus Danuiimicrobium aquiferis TaxID=1801832 RepID=A0A1G1KX68_9BACT|nr:MAG: hypothetical protein A3B72_01485 [Omnitrophica bacterium RIFCSPHIGHO2_02_FULL_45_28]OGW89157.1 MAG: hypothetical protein A3E74_06280 [Omnitrophica bacterium RIFCSPHIGHO2_12_FULL_44_12]OGW97536.1 MAG: hypothetical protein A3G33_05115 [Omnitrophica bacterium RIFCSPLOWO2_12_FULL_44_17]OGX02089.1 MAG: hypothetical protein A3J12_06410 [Omnitrophica bacterium RIFCSPLOWO2_02_FULL_44_11]